MISLFVKRNSETLRKMKDNQVLHWTFIKFFVLQNEKLKFGFTQWNISLQCNFIWYENIISIGNFIVILNVISSLFF